ncbi:MAG: AmmeMemoRadiSam system protein B [Thermodesulfobacteriota bacterium]|nr:AmmeMemoRadiSam system protein B [Thermodesulfobacteriota bacterium]
MYYLKSFLIIFFTFSLVSLFAFESFPANNIRMPVWAGKFYPAKQSELKQTIDTLTQKAKQTAVKIHPNKELKAIILPHAGYIYSGFTAAHASIVLSEKQFNKVILLGPDHRVGFRNCAISNVKGYQTPLGFIRLHEDTKILLKKSNLFQYIQPFDEVEHSLEVILPFLQYYLKEFELVPIVMGRTSEINAIANVIEPLLDSDTLLLVSSDLSHFLPYSKAVTKDKETIDIILNYKPKELKKRENCACGKIPILILMEIARRQEWRPVLFNYSNSGDTAGDRSKVVGYAAIAYFSEASLSQKQGQVLVKLARKTIMEKIGKTITSDKARQLSEALKDSCFKESRGTFVTLKIDGRLRGCIGSLTSNESILTGIIRNALNAAFRDPRFPPLTTDEFEHVDIEISILTKPQQLEYTDYSDLLSKLRVNVDGVIIRKGRAGATFLPQVWKQLPEPENFLSRLCAKAGLSADSWKNTKLEVLTYQVQYFEE